MSNRKHSPAPWTAEESGNVYDSEAYEVAHVDRPEDRNLVAAAPDMLEALEARQVFEEGRGYMDPEDFAKEEHRVLELEARSILLAHGGKPSDTEHGLTQVQRMDNILEALGEAFNALGRMGGNIDPTHYRDKNINPELQDKVRAAWLKARAILTSAGRG